MTPKMFAPLIVAAVVVLTLSSAWAKTPLPGKAQGSGTERTAGVGTIGGKPFRAVSAIAQYATPGGDIYIYIFGKPVANACRVVSYADAPYVWVWLHTEGTPPVVGRPSRSNGRDVVQVNFVLQGHYVAVQPGVRLVLTRVDPKPNGLWRGRLTVNKTFLSGKTYAYSGTFAARWCGR
jgi:hypothetical protein